MQKPKKNPHTNGLNLRTTNQTNYIASRISQPSLNSQRFLSKPDNLTNFCKGTDSIREPCLRLRTNNRILDILINTGYKDKINI